MKLLDRLSKIYKNLFRRRRLSAVNPSNNHEDWFTHISPVGVFTILISIILFIFVVVLFLAGYTSMLNIFSMYRTESDRTRTALVESIVRIDSIETQMLNMAAFNSNIALIMDGESPISHSATLQDSSMVSSGSISANNLEVLLRSQIEQSERYNLGYQTSNESDSRVNLINFTTPIEGIITEYYDLSTGNYGVKIASQPNTMVYASNTGIVLNSLWSPDFGYIVEILHLKGDLSMYKNLSQSLVEKGQSIERGEVIGYSSDGGHEGSPSKLFEFELWITGKPVNPEHYINF